LYLIVIVDAINYKSKFIKMATNQKNQGRDDKNQKGRGNKQESRSNSKQENQGSSNENRGSSQETQGNSDDNSSNRGFAAMDDEKQREIASKGGKAAHESGHAHEFTSEEARKAGRKGGQH
jgi:general stress protein YciG